jgi:hypothetical protein
VVGRRRSCGGGPSSRRVRRAGAQDATSRRPLTDRHRAAATVRADPPGLVSSGDPTRANAPAGKPGRWTP